MGWNAYALKWLKANERKPWPAERKWRERFTFPRTARLPPPASSTGVTLFTLVHDVPVSFLLYCETVYCVHCQGTRSHCLIIVQHMNLPR